MDTKTILSQAKARFSHNQNKEYLKNKYEAKLLIANQGGLWKITPELITFLASEDTIGIILTDNYGHPVVVRNRLELFTLAQTTYNDVMQAWVKELRELENNR